MFYLFQVEMMAVQQKELANQMKKIDLLLKLLIICFVIMSICVLFQRFWCTIIRSTHELAVYASIKMIRFICILVVKWINIFVSLYFFSTWIWCHLSSINYLMHFFHTFSFRILILSICACWLKVQILFQLCRSLDFNWIFGWDLKHYCAIDVLNISRVLCTEHT